MSAVRPGYSQTEVGVIPEDWSCSSLRSFGRVVRGGSPRPAGDPRYFNGTYRPWLTVASLTGLPDSQIYVRSTVSSLTEAGAKRSRELPAGTFILANSGFSLGVAKVLGMDCCANDGIAALLDLHAEVHSPFLVHYINSITQILRSTVATGNEQPNLNTDRIGKILVPLPSLVEQQAIAEALGDANALIDGLEALIVKKRNIKQGAMQDLLTGHRRLPGFRGQWTKAALGGLGQWNGGATPSMSRADFWNDGTFPWVSSSDVRVGVITPAHLITNKAVKESSTTLVGRGAILFVTRSGILRRFLPVALAQMPIAINQDIKALTLRPGLLESFIFHALVSASEEILASCMKSGTTVESIELVWLKRFEIAIPPSLDEQNAIAAVLSDMDEEIAALENKLTKARAVKQGMTQVLLTGEIRLI